MYSISLTISSFFSNLWSDDPPYIFKLFVLDGNHMRIMPTMNSGNGWSHIQRCVNTWAIEDYLSTIPLGTNICVCVKFCKIKDISTSQDFLPLSISGCDSYLMSLLIFWHGETLFLIYSDSDMTNVFEWNVYTSDKSYGIGAFVLYL